MRSNPRTAELRRQRMLEYLQEEHSSSEIYRHFPDDRSTVESDIQVLRQRGRIYSTGPRSRIPQTYKVAEAGVPAPPASGLSTRDIEVANGAVKRCIEVAEQHSAQGGEGDPVAEANVQGYNAAVSAIVLELSSLLTPGSPPLSIDGSAEIARLRRENEELHGLIAEWKADHSSLLDAAKDLRGALEPFAREAEKFTHLPDNSGCGGPHQFNVGHLRRARALTEEGREGQK